MQPIAHARKKYSTMLPELIINPIVGNYIKYFPVNEKKHSVFQLKLAKWQLEHRKYAQAILSINESIITYICEAQKLEWDDFDNLHIGNGARCAYIPSHHHVDDEGDKGDRSHDAYVRLELIAHLAALCLGGNYCCVAYE